MRSLYPLRAFLHVLSLSLMTLFLSSCSTAPVNRPLYPTTEAYPRMTGPIMRHDVSHVLAPGETLWRLSKMYNVTINDIMRANNVKDPREIKMGQCLLIPGAAPLRPVIPLYRSKKWKYIIVHHSATDQGSALSLFDLHLKRGFAGLGYHFVIGNGSCGKENGQLEASPRWIKQQDGAHCKASQMNHQGIGICLVGNFSRENVSEKQMESLVYAVNVLRKYYNIPLRNIMGHGQVPGAATECPGTNFPWEEFKHKLTTAK